MSIHEIRRTWIKESEETCLNRHVTAEQLSAMLESGIKKGRRAVAKRFILEMAGILAIFGLVVLSLVVFHRNFRPFQVKLFILSFLGILPVMFMFWQYFRQSKSMDFSIDVKHHLEEALHSLKRTLRVYAWSGYAFGVVITAVFFTDPSFRQLPAGWQVGTYLYILVIMLCSGPYIRLTYGKQVRSLENQLRALNQNADDEKKESEN